MGGGIMPATRIVPQARTLDIRRRAEVAGGGIALEGDFTGGA
jgi:hypothetical protein